MIETYEMPIPEDLTAPEARMYYASAMSSELEHIRKTTPKISRLPLDRSPRAMRAEITIHQRALSYQKGNLLQ